MRTSRDTPTNRSWLMTVLVATYASNFVDRTIVNVLQQPIKVELGLHDWQLGLLGGTTFAIFYTALGLYVARIAEKRNRVTILTLCVLAWSAFTALCGAVTSFAQLLLLRIGVAVGEAGATPTGHSLISDHYPAEKRAGALAIFASGNTLGSIIGALIGAYVGVTWGWRAAFVVAGVPGLLLAAIVYFTLRDPRARVPVSAADVPPMTDVARTLLAKPSFRHLAIGAGVMLFAAYGIFAFAVPHFMRTHELPLDQAGLIGGVGSGVMLGVGTIGGGFLAQRLAANDRRWLAWVLALSMTVAAPLAILTFLTVSTPVAALLYLTLAMFLGVFQGPLFGMLHSLVLPRMRATASAMMLLSMTLVGLGLGPLLVGLGSDSLAGMAYGPGFASACGASATLGERCQQASAQGLQVALAACALPMIWAAVHFALAARSLRADVID